MTKATASSNLDKQIIELYATELTLDQIAQKLSIGNTTLRNKITELGLKREPRLRSKNIAKEDIITLEEKGLSYRDIAYKLDIHPATLLYLRKKFGIYNPPQKVIDQQAKAAKARAENKKAGVKAEVNRKFSKLDLYLDEIVKLLKSGVSKAEVARRYNSHPTTVFNLLALHEIEIPVVKKLDGKEKTIKHLFEKGLSEQEIANKLKCSLTILITKIKELKLTREKSDIKINSRLAKEEKLIRRMYEQGCSIQDISEKVKAHPVSVGIKIRKMGLTRAKKISEYRTKLFGQDKKLVKMRNKGMSYKEIAQALDVSPNTVMNHFKKMESKERSNA